ncbi:hypothetical protein Ahy_A08g037531 [Arachis hypogaea]|uniref:RNase H type-1 domain-containing protein n=1 Tax=Arachis hypogaea TaxID=3818 RepID=A0A445BR25_ARAHY|nr:hypothetical protein Ahy_A08g037531 [Arachis hypogaea]
MNVDSSFFSHNNNDAYGGVFRDHLCRFVKAFACNLESYSIMQAELWAILKGLQLAITNGLQNILVESDSLMALSFVREGCPNSHPCASLIEYIRILVSRVQHIAWRHTLREANPVADILAKKGQELIHGLHVFDYPTSEIKSALCLDGIGSFSLTGSG